MRSRAYDLHREDKTQQAILMCSYLLSKRVNAPVEALIYHMTRANLYLLIDDLDLHQKDLEEAERIAKQDQESYLYWHRHY